MIACGAGETLCRAAGHDAARSTELLNEWAAQTADDVQRLSGGDFALTAWLAAHVAMISPGAAAPPFGGVLDRISHVVIDEAQDVALAHVGLLRRVLVPGGTMTLVGDLRQRVAQRGHFAAWDEFGLTPARRAVFDVNYRQSAALGEFVRTLHTRLYGRPPAWRASSRRGGAGPRVRPCPDARRLAGLVAEEVEHWRDAIPGGTVAVLFHGNWTGAKKLQRALETRLQHALTEVHLATGAGRSDRLKHTDCVLISTVVGTKGLEFDAVVVIDPKRLWDGRPDRVGRTRRNALYVAASRAKEGLSLLLSPDAEVVAGV